MKTSIQMKFIALIFMSLAVFTSCQQSRDESTNNNTSNICITTPSACNPQIYQNNQGFSQYPGLYGGNPFVANSYLCNCPVGSVPTYNSYGGLGCVQAGFVGSATVSLGWGPQNNQWLNIPQISNHVGYSNQGCYNGVVQSCIITQPNSCPVGSTCQATGSNSYMGICSR